MNKIILSLTFVFLLSSFGFGQQTEINRAEYYKFYQTALAKGENVSRRNTVKEESFRDGKLYRTDEYLYEYLLPDREYYSHKEVFSGKVNIVEQIKIGETYYCRRDKKVWKKSENWCADGSVSSLPDKISEKFTVENIESGSESLKLYQQITTYKNTFSPNKDKEGLSYWKRNFWTNKDGYIVKTESEDGLSEPARINRKSVEVYEYDPKGLMIEAPIKIMRKTRTK